MPPRHFANRKGPPQLPPSGFASSHAESSAKSSFERAKEAEEAKRRKEEDETRAAYEEFVRSFHDDGNAEIGFVQSGHGSQGLAPIAKRKLGQANERSLDADSYGLKRRQIEGLGELKRPDQIRKHNVPRDDSPEISLSQTLHLAGLLPSSTEASVTKLVNEFGNVRSVAIQPRDPKRRGIAAHVVLEHADEVDKARASLDRRYLGSGYWLSAATGRGTTSRLDTKSALPFGAQLPSEIQSGPGFAPPPSVGISQGYSTGQSSRLQVRVQYPESLQSLRRIHAVIENILKFGPEFEAAIRLREEMNPDFAFLFDSSLPEHIYFRWKLWSIASGEGIDKWSTQPAEIFANGVLWIPPTPPPSLDDELARLDNDDDEAEADGRSQLPWLGPLGHLHLTLLLQHISSRRGSIARLMAFAIDNSNAAEEIVDVVCDSVTGPSAAPQMRIARLWAIGDILYNSGMGIGGVNKGVWKYRGLFQTRLVSVFASLYDVFKAFDGRIRAENFKRQVLSIIGVWEGWNVFTLDALKEMTHKFLRQDAETVEDPVPEGQDKAAEQTRVGKQSTSKWKKIDKTGAEALPVENKPVRVEDLIDPDLDGEPLTESDDEEENEEPNEI